MLRQQKKNNLLQNFKCRDNKKTTTTVEYSVGRATESDTVVPEENTGG